MSQLEGTKPISPSDFKEKCQCVTTPCNCDVDKQTPTIVKEGMTNTQKWLAIIGLTLVTYYVILKINKQ